MDAVTRVATILEDIKRTRAERVLRARLLTVAILFKVWPALDHFRRRRPARPLLLVLNIGAALPFKARLTDANAITERFTTREHVV